jgi:hypothetical protein
LEAKELRSQEWAEMSAEEWTIVIETSALASRGKRRKPSNSGE